MNRETRRFVESLPRFELDVIEISGDRWDDPTLGFRTYRNYFYPDFDICDAPFGSEICDLVILEQVLEHVRSPARALRNSLEMLRPGGWVLVTTPFLIRFHPQPQDLYRWTADGLRILLEEAGFRQVKTNAWGNRDCLIADMTPGPDWTYFDPKRHSLVNEPQFPLSVWGTALRPPIKTTTAKVMKAGVWSYFLLSSLILANGEKSRVLRERPWSLRVAGQERAELLTFADPERLRVSIEQQESQATFDIQLNRDGYEVAKNGRYRVTMAAKADAPREMGLGFSKGGEPWSNLGLYRVLPLTTEWSEFSQDFRIASDEDNARIHFDLGGSGISVELSLVRLWKVAEDGLIAMSTSSPSKPKNLRTSSTQDILTWRDRIVMEAAAYMEQGETEPGEAWLKKLENATIDAWTLEKTDPYLSRIARGRRVVASFDPARRPADDEVVIVYGNYPHFYENVVVNNPIRRHVTDFWSLQHDKVEADPRWSGIGQIFLINLDMRMDRYDATLRELASMRAPFDRVTRFSAIKPADNDETELGRHVACLRSHIEVLRQARANRQEHVLVLEDDFSFSSDIEQHLTDLGAFYQRNYDYWICLLSTSKYGAIQPKDDLVSLSFQPVTGTAGYLISRAGIEELLPVFEAAVERLAMKGNLKTDPADRCWSVLQPSGKFFTFRRKFGFQVSSFSDITGDFSRDFD
ncbi:methyltransferase domain-containing protein [Bauldia litoralis]|uniref:Glycosyltransferase involved in LPS biosynthesis, GR25 family n=1 Tax=Bauldia litoralis TaxID=665467 RepID=A0A1G6E9Y7_9HYPH|nr:methyltransferase domain-containing protein [Bauldia litoralis]SDB54216.1 Glycosyltransferase involved in LPS biosynthesis, GR25 family [Bauldia litoralis]